MKIIVVYESLWGSTAAVARAIAEGIGEGAMAMSAGEATPTIAGGAGLVVAGAPVHSMSPPTKRTREWARAGKLGPGGAPPDLSHPIVRTWLEHLPRGNARSAAFDTRVQGWYGRGAASKIERALNVAGYPPIAQGRGCCVSGHP